MLALLTGPLSFQIESMPLRRFVEHDLGKPVSTFPDHALASPEYPGGTQHDQHRHDQIDQDRAERRDVILSGDVADAEKHRRRKRAADRAKPANRDDDENINEVGEGEGWIEPNEIDG